MSIFSSCFVIGFFSESTTVENISRWSTWIRLTTIMFLLFMGAGIPVLIANSIGKSFYLNRSKNFEKQIESQAKHYEELAKSNYELRRFRHDYKNTQLVVGKLLSDGQIDSALEILKQNDIEINRITEQMVKFDTGNGIVDALLTEKQKTASSINTDIIFEGSIPMKPSYSIDLCTIFSNAVDNAIEACGKLPTDSNKTINISCNCRGGFLFLTITNPVIEDINIKNNLIPTSKKDKNNHGFGLFSLQEIVKKHHGTLNISCNNKIFELNIEMDLEE